MGRSEAFSNSPFFTLACFTKHAHSGTVRKVQCSKCDGLNDRLPQRYCRSCHAAHMRKTRPKYRELPSDVKARAKCRSYTHSLIRRGNIKREGCRVCGETAQVHHLAYPNPRAIEWLCRTHHRAKHSEKIHKKNLHGLIDRLP